MHSRLGAELIDRLTLMLPDVQITPIDPDEAAAGGQLECDILVANTLPAGLLTRAPNLRWLQLTSVGTDQLAAAGQPKGLIVTTAGDVPTLAVAEFVLMAMLALAKNAQALLHHQHQHAWHPNYTPPLLHGQTLLLLGLGRVGRAVATRAKAFGMRVVAVTRTPHPHPNPTAADLVVTPDHLLEIAPQALFLVAAVPGTKETAGMISRELLRALPDGAFVINVARASVLDTDALVAELDRLGGALLDVHDTEPLPPTSPLWQTDRLWVTPHTAFGFPGEGAKLADLICENYAHLRDGTTLRNHETNNPDQQQETA